MAGPINIVLTDTPLFGSTLIAVVGTGDLTGTGVTSITQAAVTWQLAVKASTNRTLEIWYAQNVNTADKNVVINFGATPFDAAVVVVEYQNLRASTPLIDQISTSIGVTNKPTTGTTALTTQGNELWVGGVMNRGGDTLVGGTEINDFLLQAQDGTGFGPSDVNVGFLDREVTAVAQAFTEITSSGGIADWAGAMATFFGPFEFEATASLDMNIFGTADASVAAAFGPLALTSGMDMWVADGGAQSQLYALDTVVSRPLITGNNLINDPGIDVAFSIANLDADVVAIILGPSVLGVVSLSLFINNGDGTGTFLATFDPDIPSRQLAIIARDDVDNESEESPVFIVNSLQQVRLGDELTIVPRQSASDPTCQDMLENVPETTFILTRQFTVPYSFNSTVFELRAVTPLSPVTITVTRRGLPGEPDESQQRVIIPEKEIELIDLQLGRGINIVSVTDRFSRDFSIIVAAASYVSVLCAYAREIFNHSRVLIDEQDAQIFSPISTRLADPLIDFSDLLPDVRSQQTLATKLIVRSFINSPGRQVGVQDVLTGLTLSTPIFVEQNPDNELFEPSILPLFNSQEAFAGVESHVWLPNECVREWLAFIRYINNLDAFKLISITENEVVFLDDNGDLRRHVFDFGAGRCSLTNLALQSLCFQDLAVNVAIFSESDIVVCAATYPFDLRPIPSAPIGQIDGETGEGGFDPGFDGYLDFSVSDHWDGGVALDSQGPMPSSDSGLDVCVNQNGYLVEPLLVGSADTTIGVFINATGEFDVIAPALGSDMDVLIDLPVFLTSALSINIHGDTAALDVSITAIQEIEIGLSIAITGVTVPLTAGMSMQID